MKWLGGGCVEGGWGLLLGTVFMDCMVYEALCGRKVLRKASYEQSGEVELRVESC